MKCIEVEELLADYLDRKLDSQMMDKVDEHIQSCEQCLEMVRESRKILDTIALSPMEKPDDSLRSGFYSMLDAEMHHTRTHPKLFSNRQLLLRAAASVAILITGALAGTFITISVRNSSEGEKLVRLQSEVESLKRTAMFSMLRDESSSGRIQAVSYAADLPAGDDNVTAVLFTTLNSDKNVNVRLAAAYALARFCDRKSVRDSLVKSLPHQTDPIIQVTLINILVEKKERDATASIRSLISSPSTLREVKAVAESGLKVLL
ncbi:MAG TPA: zf-HC2 domain-containing protein [Bacteroidales bacterium]|nr:zf-HC2 domain-containing protein [Bacteroidales bacterium]